MNVREVVFDALRRLTNAVEEPVRNARTEAVHAVLGEPQEPLGNDGLAEHERVADLVAYRTGVGRRPEMTDDLRLKLDTVSEKLFGTTHTVHRAAR